MSRRLYRDPGLFKPLLAFLFRNGIAKFIVDSSFRHLVLELDIDEQWEECSTKHIAIDRSSSQWAIEEALKDFFGNQIADDDDKIVDVILGYMRWSQSAIDLKELVNRLKELGISENVISRFRTKAKRLSHNKEVQIVPGKAERKHRNIKKVFIVHGHDTTSRLELEKLLKERFNLEPVILQDKPSDSLDTIISKFEKAADECGTAIILFTPDDQMSNGTAHPRLNVILELGFFMGRDQGENRRILLLKKSNAVGPSDVHGVETINFEKSVDDAFIKLERALKHLKVV